MKRKESHDTLPSKISKPNYPSEEPTHPQRVEFINDVIYEISKWLSSSDVLRNCVLINKQWMSVLKQRAELQFTLDDSQWKSFSEVGFMANRVTQLSISHTPTRYLSSTESVDLLTKTLKSMDSLEKLSLVGMSMKDDLMESIIRKDSLKEFRITRVRITPEHVALLKKTMPALKLFVGPYCLSSGDRLDSDCLGFLSGFGSDALFGYDDSDNEEFAPSLYGDLAKGGNITELHTKLNALSAKYLPLMKNLEHLTIYKSELGYDQVPDLSALSKLKSVVVCDSFTTGRNSTVGSRLYRLIGSPDRLTHLEFRSSCNTKDLEIIPRAKNLSTLICDNLCIQKISISGLRLTNLQVTGCVINHEFAHALKDMVSLRRLAIVHTYINDKSYPFTIADLCDYRDGTPECRLKLLTSLRISPPPEKKDVFKSLCAMNCLENLVLLKTQRHGGDIHDIEDLSQNKSITRLTLIDFEMDSRIIEGLGKMGRLTHLRIKAPSINDACLESISSMNNLRRLQLQSFQLNEFENIAQRINSMTNLHTVGLRGFVIDHKDEKEIRATVNTVSWRSWQ